jgi:hypothetical protein
MYTLKHGGRAESIGFKSFNDPKLVNSAFTAFIPRRQAVLNAGYSRRLQSFERLHFYG